MTRTDYSRRAYSPEERARVTALAETIGDKAAARETGISERTIRDWLGKASRGALRPVEQAVVERSRADVAGVVRDVREQALAKMAAGLADPHARLLDVTRAFEALDTAHRLDEGRATSHVDSFSLHADAGSVEYNAATPEVQMAADRLVRDALTELVAGASAAALAGVAVPRIELDGLRVRAALSPTDQAAVTALLAQLEGALAAGVDAGAIIEGLTKTKIGGTDA